MNTVTTKQRNHLTQAQSFKLCHALTNLNQAGGITVDSTFKGLAEYCTQLLGFEVNDNNVRGAFKVLELRLPQAPKSPEQQLQDRIKKLENTVRMLCTELNVPCTFDYA